MTSGLWTMLRAAGGMLRGVVAPARWVSAPSSSWRRAVGSALYLAVVAGMGTALGPVFTPYLLPAPVVTVTVNPSVLANWEGPEEAAFQVILARFKEQHRVVVSYRTARQVPAYLNDALAAGTYPDVAILPQPGVLTDLARRGRLVPLDGIVDRRSLTDLDATWTRYASWDHRLYGVYFKAANKSVVWYRPDLFRRAGIRGVPATWDELLADVGQLRRAAITPFAMCGSSGWTLTDWFENLYLQTAGREAYEALAEHRGGASWRDPAVARALGLMAQVFTPENAANGTVGILSTPYPDCVNLVVSGNSSNAMIMEGDFVQNQVQSLGRTLTIGPNGALDFFPFPAVHTGQPPGVIVGGDVAVMLRDSPQARELVNYLATPGAGRTWARQGGFISPHRSVRTADYPNAASRMLADRVTNPASRVVFDMSDQAPAGFGSTVGEGEWAALQQWLSGPAPASAESIQAVQDQLERAAVAAYPPS